MKGQKVIIALSGGVDSSVSAILLKEQGFDLIGITLRMFDTDQNRIDPLAQSIKDASVLADKLQIPYYILNVETEFNKIVIDNFITEYQSGRTPNPCALCNPEVKWNSLLKFANEIDCKYIATGHYAQIKESNGRYFISKGIDEVKDQSYFLWQLNQEQLRRTIFPLGGFKKEEIKKIAALKGFNKISTKRESYNICFIPDGNYRNYLIENSKIESQDKIGNIVTTAGEVIDSHPGIENYTIGQKIGLNVNNDEVFYISEINSKDKSIVVSPKKILQNIVVVKNLKLSKYHSISEKTKIRSKLGYRGPEIKSKIFIHNNELIVKLEEPVFATSPGQSIAFYEGNDLIGGGIIT